MKSKNVYILCTMDTKEEEGRFLVETAKRYGLHPVLVDIGIRKESPPGVAVSNRKIAEAAGSSLEQLMDGKVRIHALKIMSQGLLNYFASIHGQDSVDAVIAAGGSGGMSVVAEAMCSLPFGIPKVMVTSVASGNIRPYIKGRDIFVLNPVADLIGLNCITKTMLSQAMAALNGMVECKDIHERRPETVAITSFGATDPCIQRCFEWFRNTDRELIAFHARGISGGMAMEELVREGFFSAVIDLTTTEVADYLCEGMLPCDENRFVASIEADLPLIIAPGAVDMVNYAGEETIPASKRDRQFQRHGSNTILMRTNEEENVKIAEFIAEKIKKADHWRLLIPTKGFSVYSMPGQPFYNPQADGAFIETIKSKLGMDERIVYCDCGLCDEQFANAVIENYRLLTENHI